MNRFLIEREIPGASELSESQLAEIATNSNAVAASLGVPYRWITSYVAGDKIYCIHEPTTRRTIREHARRGGFPANVVVPVATNSVRHRGSRRHDRLSTATHSTWWVSGNESNTRNSLHRVAVASVEPDVARE